MISNEVFAAALHCRRKAFFKRVGEAGEMTEIERVQAQLDRAYTASAVEGLVVQDAGGEFQRDPPDLGAAIQSRPHRVVGATARAGNVNSRLELLERRDDGASSTPVYAPVLFVRNNKVTRGDKFLLGFQALALSLVQGAVPDAGKIVAGSERKMSRVKLPTLVEEARRVTALIEADAAKGTAPPLTLNRHCAACEFRQGCRAQAEQADDLSLLRVLSVKEVQKLRSRGVTTLTQFSHTYHPGRRGKRKAEKSRKHDPALQALALREKKVYVMDAPALSRPKVALYLDVEGVPERDSYYLIGLLVVQEAGSTFHSFWADDASQEKGIWDACRQVIEDFPDYALYHYGQYETRFLERMKKRGSQEEAAAIDRILTRSCNLLTVIHSHVYFPTHSNGLKDVAGLLGFRWSVEGASGLQALAWRLAWDSGKEETLKQSLVLYNREDCLALKSVTEFVLSLCDGSRAGANETHPPVALADEIQRPGHFHFGKQTFFCPELEHINKCAYSDYQREKVYVRTSPAVRKSLQRKLREGKRKLTVNQEVKCQPPEKCPECGRKKVSERSLFPAQTSHKIVFDLKFTRSGVKRWLVRYGSRRYQCGRCQATFLAAE